MQKSHHEAAVQPFTGLLHVKAVLVPLPHLRSLLISTLTRYCSRVVSFCFFMTKCLQKLDTLLEYLFKFELSKTPYVKCCTIARWVPQDITQYAIALVEVSPPACYLHGLDARKGDCPIVASQLSDRMSVSRLKTMSGQEHEQQARPWVPLAHAVTQQQ